MAYSTVALFLARIDAQFVADLTSALGGSTIDAPENRLKIQAALDDASAELDGFKPRIADAHWPQPDTLRVHTHKVAFYLLTLGRPGKEFEQVRNAYEDTIKFYEALVTATAAAGGAPPIDGAAEIPCRVFTDKGFRGF